MEDKTSTHSFYLHMALSLWTHTPWHRSLAATENVVLLTKMVLDLHKQGQFINFNHVEGEAFLPEAPSPPNAVEVGLIVRLLYLVYWKIEVHNNSDLLHINP